MYPDIGPALTVMPVERERTRVLYVLGFEGRFPPLLRRILAEEFPDVAIRETEDIAACRVPHRHGDVVLLHESVVRHLDASGAQPAQGAGRNIVALVYASTPPNRAAVRTCLAAGIESFLSLHTQLDLLVSAVSMMLSGGRFISPEIVDMHLSEARPSDNPVSAGPPAGSPRLEEAPPLAASPPPAFPVSPGPAIALDGLTAREREVLVLVAAGKQNKVIAHELGLSESTVKLHVHHLIAKLGVRNRTGLAVMYHARGGARPGVPAS